MIRRRRVRQDEDAFQSINITPFTDVLLVLLIIFLIAGSSLTPTGVGLDQIEAQGSGEPGPDEPEEANILFVQANGEISLRQGGRLVSNPDLSELDISQPLSVSAAPTTKTELVVAQYDELLRRGFVDLRLAEPRLVP